MTCIVVVQDSALPLDSLGDALTPSDALHATDKVLDKQLHSTFTEKKQALMFDVETVYNTAVQLKSDALRKHTQLSFEQRDATQRLVAVRAEYARLEMQIKQLESRRQQAEVAREAVTAAVHSSLQSIKTTVSESFAVNSVVCQYPPKLLLNQRTKSIQYILLLLKIFELIE